MGTKIKIRRADGYDVVRVTRLLERGAAEQAEGIWYPRPSQSSTKKIGAVLALIDQGFVLVAEAFTQEEGAPAAKGLIVGAIGMAFARDNWSDDWCLNNEWFYVHKDWRDTEVADKLLTGIELFADTQIDPSSKQPVKIPILLGLLTGTDTTLKDMLMRRRGYQYGGSNFVRAPNYVENEEDDRNPVDSNVVGTGQPESDGDGVGDR